ncbi:MAG: tRNA dimethylallyltransferase [Flammeovirgaceae bacterium]|jgi:tRNA dimethylallyltransferase
MRLMLEQDLFGEAKSVYQFREKNALQTVGYKEIFAFIDGEYDRERMVELLKQNSRRYAKSRHFPPLKYKSFIFLNNI